MVGATAFRESQKGTASCRSIAANLEERVPVGERYRTNNKVDQHLQQVRLVCRAQNLIIIAPREFVVYEDWILKLVQIIDGRSDGDWAIVVSIP